MFAILGDIEFTVAGGITGLDLRETVNWAEHARIQGKPLLEWIGDGLDECSLTIELHPVLGDPEARLRALRQAKSTHQPLAFVMGSGDYLGVYVITDLNTNTRRATAVGQTTGARVWLSLREYTGDVTRAVGRPGVLDSTLSGTSAATLTSPELVSKLNAAPSTTQQVIGHAKTAGNMLRAGQNLYDTIKSGNATMILGQVPQLLGMTARAIEPLEGLQAAAVLLDGGGDLSRLGGDVLGSVQGAQASLKPVDLSNIIDRFAASHESVLEAMSLMDGASVRLAGLAADVLTRRQ